MTSVFPSMASPSSRAAASRGQHWTRPNGPTGSLIPWAKHAPRVRRRPWGAGGSIGFADPEAGLAFSYTINQMGNGILLNDRGQSLIDAAYRSLGYRTNAPGAWVK